MEHIPGINRNQMMIISMEQMVHKEAFVRIIDAFVNTIDVESFGFTNSVHNSEGRPPYHPSDLLKLWFYGYRYNLRSCRKLEHATKVNIEVMWLLKNLQPHYKTIADFRKNNAEAFQNVFRQFVLLLKQWKFVDGKNIAIDSFKVRAQNSLKNNFNQKKIDRHITYIDDKLDGYLKAFKECKDADKKKELRQKLKYNRSKKSRYQELEK
jgi:transposase